MDENASSNPMTQDSPEEVFVKPSLEHTGVPLETRQDQDGAGSVTDGVEDGRVDRGAHVNASLIEKYWEEVIASQVDSVLPPPPTPLVLSTSDSSMSTQTTQTELSLQSCVALHQSGNHPQNWTDSHDKFRILLIFANPTNTHPLRLQAEEKAIREALQRGECRENIHVDVLLACTVDDLARQLMSTAYELIHFSGHADRSASLFRHTMKALHTSHDADLNSLKSPEVSKQVEEAVEVMARRFESSLLSSTIHSPSINHNSSHGKPHCLHYSPVHPITPGSNVVHRDSTRKHGPDNITVTSTHHRNRVEKDICHHTNDDSGTAVPSSTQQVSDMVTVGRIITPASVARHCRVREVEVATGAGCDRAVDCTGFNTQPIIPFGSVKIDPKIMLDEKGNQHHNFEHELHIPKLQVRSRTDPSKLIHIEYRRKYNYQDIMDLGIGSLAFETESHDTSSGISFVSPPSLASLIAQHCGSSLQCVLLNVCGGHIQADVLSSIVPYTVCFTGKVADKESLAFSRGFYDSIAMGQSVLDAFRAGSGRMDLHKLSPGVPDRFSSLPPLLTLLKNQRLADEAFRLALIKQQQRLKLEQQKDQVTPLDSYHADLEAKNQKLAQENQELRSLVSYGMDLMKSKCEQLESMRMALEFVSKAAGMGGNIPANKKLGYIGKYDSGSSCLPADNRNSKTKPGTSAKKKFLNVKSSGYGRVRSAKNNGKETEPNFIKRNKMILKNKSKKKEEKKSEELEEKSVGLLPTRTESSISQKRYMTATSTFSSINSSLEKSVSHGTVKKNEIITPDNRKHQQKQKTPAGSAHNSPARKKMGTCHQHHPSEKESNQSTPFAPYGPVPTLAPSPPDPVAVKMSVVTCASNARSRAESNPLPPSPSRHKKSHCMNHTISSSTPASSPQRITQKGFSTTIALAKPKSWAKFYNSDTEGTNDERNQSSDEMVEANKSDPSQGQRKAEVTRKRSSTASSEGWRNFLKERRAERKPSSSFASSVPRFDSTLP